MECCSTFRNWVGMRIMGLMQVSSIGILIILPLILIGISALDLVCFFVAFIHVSSPLGEKYKKSIYVLVGLLRRLVDYTNQRGINETIQ